MQSQQLRQALGYPLDKDVTFERFSDSVGGYVVLDPKHPAVFKTLVRAAKAKLKLRLKATVASETHPEKAANTVNNLAAQLPEVPKGPVVARSSASSTISHKHPNPPFMASMARSEASSAVEAPVPFPFALPQPKAGV